MVAISPTRTNEIATTKTANENSSAYLRDFLRQYGLESLTDWAEEELAKGYDDTVVLQHMREQPAYKERFKVIVERERLGLPPMSPAEVIEYETAARQLMVSAGLPKGFYDSPEDFAQLMIEDKSIDEIKNRVINGFARAQQAPQGVRDAFREFYGPDGDTALASFFLDPDKAMPLLETQMQAATISGTGRRFGIGTGRSLAEELARQGVTDQEATQNYAQLAASSGLFNENVDEHADYTVDKEGVEAAFGVSEGSRKKVEKRGESRQAAFAGSGGAAVGQKGAAGLGAAGKY